MLQHTYTIRQPTILYFNKTNHTRLQLNRFLLIRDDSPVGICLLSGVADGAAPTYIPLKALRTTFLSTITRFLTCDTHTRLTFATGCHTHSLITEFSDFTFYWIHLSATTKIFLPSWLCDPEV